MATNNRSLESILPELLTTAQVADYLSLTPQTVITFIKRGELEATKPPGMRGYRIPKEAFMRYLAEGYRSVEQEVIDELKGSEQRWQ